MRWKSVAHSVSLHHSRLVLKGATIMDSQQQQQQQQQCANNNELSTATTTATATTMRSVATSQRILLGRNKKNKDVGDSTSTSRCRRRRSTSTNAIKCRRQQGCSNLIPCYWSYALVGADTSAAAIPSIRGDYRSHYETILLVSVINPRTNCFDDDATATVVVHTRF